MFIYNITIKVSHAIAGDWLTWMQNEYITAVMESSCFTKQQLVQLRDIDEEEGPTYALQLYAESKANYNRYVTRFLPSNEVMSFEKWGNDVISFSTLMEIIN